MTARIKSTTISVAGSAISIPRRTEGSLSVSSCNCALHDLVDDLKERGFTIDEFSAPRAYHLKLEIDRDSPFVENVSDRNGKR